MNGAAKTVCLLLTVEEADELLGRCLNSEEGDTPAFQQALLKLARASFQECGTALAPSEGEAKAA